MEKKWSKIITPLIIVGVILLAIFLINQNKKETPEEIAKCIGKNSELYVQLGCHACKIQEDLFGESYQYLNRIDCFYEKDKCINLSITATPTWIIKGERYLGVQNIKTLRKKTGC